jgi:hypothetical protein
MNLSDRYTYEQLSERSSLDDRPVSRLFCCEVKVDRRTLKTGLGQFYIIKLQHNLSFSQLKRLVEGMSRGFSIVGTGGSIVNLVRTIDRTVNV